MELTYLIDGEGKSHPYYEVRPGHYVHADNIEDYEKRFTFQESEVE